MNDGAEMKEMQMARAMLQWLESRTAGRDCGEELARRVRAEAALEAEIRGFELTARTVPPAALGDLALPFIMERADGYVLVTGKDGDAWTVEKAGEAGAGPDGTWSADLLKSGWTGTVLITGVPSGMDTRGASVIRLKKPHWLWSTLWRYRHTFFSASVFTLLINLFALSTTIFVMSVYDRVVPNQAYTTLWALGLGVLLAVIMEFVARHVRSHALDKVGQQVDVLLSGRIFAKALTRPLLTARKGSTGTTAATLREFDAVREFVASATLTVLADLPFVVLFLFFIGMVAGPLALVPASIFAVMLGLSIIVQIPLARLGREHMQMSVTRQGLAVESLDGIETLKALHGETQMVARHGEVSERAAGINLRTRGLSNLMSYTSGLMMQLATLVTVTWGTYLVGDGELTMGALIAAVLLNGRVLAPLQAIAGLASRLQQTRVAMGVLNQLMAPEDEAEQLRPIRKLGWGKLLHTDNLCFAYAENGPQAVRAVNLQIRAGERLACLGRIGSGKSTLLKLLAGLYPPAEGLVRLDGVSLAHIDAEQMRQAIGYLPQESRMFLGTLRENLTLGAPGISDEHVVKVLQGFGLGSLVAAHPLGLDMPVSERGENFSGGIRQALAIVRAVLRAPRFLLLDEPTSAMDMHTERIVMSALAKFAQESHLSYLIVTHRPALLDYVDRILVMEGGGLVADGPKEQVVKALNNNEVRVAS